LSYRKGDRVRNPNVEAWGPGLVLEDSDDRMVRVFFVEAGERTLMLSHVKPVKVVGAEAESSVLDNLKIDGGKVNIR
jgi:hypothetical protein